MQNLKLNSEDPNVRREEVENYFYNTPDDNSLKELTTLLEDPDKGVRNSLSILLTTTDNPNVADYIVRFVSSQDISIRNLAGDILLKNGDSSVDALLRFLDVGNDDDKKFCIDLLGLIGNKRSGDKIVEVLNTNENSNVILACIEALGNLHFDKSLESIKPFYFENELYKPTVIEALGKMGSKAVQEFLVEIYLEEDVVSKFAIVESLGLIGDADSINLLLKELKSTDPFMIGPIVNSLHSIKQRTNLNILVDPGSAQKIVKYIDDIEPQFLGPALELVQNNPGLDLLPIYLKVLGTNIELDESIKPLMVNKFERLLGCLPRYFESSPKNLYEILTFLKEVLFMSREIYDDLPEGNSKENLTGSVKKLLTNVNEDIRSLSCDLLFSLNEKTAIEAANIVLNDENVWNKINLLENLSNVDHEKIEFLLKELANDKEEMVRERATFLLGQKFIN